MTTRTVTSAVILGSFLALAVLSFMGNRFVSVVFVVVAGIVLIHHQVTLCPKCSNTACGFNPDRRELDPEDTVDSEFACGWGFSDLPITRTTVIPLLIVGPLAVLAAWWFSPIATLILAAVALTAHNVFRRLTCSRCGNDCVGNCNKHYHAWKRSQRPAHG